MGRRWKKKNRSKKAGQHQEAAAEQQEEEEEDTRDLSRRSRPKEWTPAVRRNDKMEAYYALQGLHDTRWNETLKEFEECTSDEEKREEHLKFLASMRAILPASFRIGTDVDPVVREHLEQELDEFVGTEMEILVDPTGGRLRTPTIQQQQQQQQQHNNHPNGNATKTKPEPPINTTTASTSAHLISKTVAPARRIPFIPHAYQLSLDRRTIRRHPRLEQFHDWLKVQTLAGLVTRQETVSMIPPVVLAVEPHHAVLDMCAAPGSKTSQILEIVSSSSNNNTTNESQQGCVVANDSDPKRAYTLVTQLKRINSPAHLVTSCDAQFFPMLNKKKKKTSLTPNGEEGMFDRVLADVPCSGDGTSRKNPGIWKHWNALGSFALHPLQLGIALNGARLTKVGGFLCYSTCALNPIENEAVVAELLRAADGSLELVDRRPDMEGLVARPGWSHWLVLCETQSRRQVKNQKNKHNAKMQQRRREWEKKRNKADESGVNGEAVEENGEKNNGDKDKMQEDVAAAAAGTSTDTPASIEEGDNENDEAENNNDGTPIETKEEGGELESFPSWNVVDLKKSAEEEGLAEFATFEDVPEEMRRRIRKSCFPPTQEEAKEFALGKCLRCLPHDMDTGGFFVALFRKVAPMSPRAKAEATRLARELRMDGVDDSSAVVEPEMKRAKLESDSTPPLPAGDAVEDTTNPQVGIDYADKEEAAPLEEEGKDPSDSQQEEMTEDVSDASEPKVAAIDEGRPLLRGKGKTRGRVGDENFVPIDNDKWEPLVDFYGLSETFPRDQYMVRAKGEAKVLYFIGRPIKELMDLGIQDRVTIINTGLKGFQRNTNDCKVKYRLSQEGIQFLMPHMTKRKLVVSLDDFTNCLGDGGICLDSFSSSFAGAVRQLEMGSFAVALDGFQQSVFKKMCLVMWKCRSDAVNCLVCKAEKDGMMSKIRALQEENAVST